MPSLSPSCAAAYGRPAADETRELLERFGYDTDFLIEDGHVWTAGLGEEWRYHRQHTLGHQMWDIDWLHFPGRHGRAEEGRTGTAAERESHTAARRRLRQRELHEDD